MIRKTGPIRRRTRSLSLSASVFALLTSFAGAGAAIAGEYTKLSDIAGTYQFISCAEPTPLAFDDQALKKIKRSPRAQARAVRRYNVYVDDMNKYFECLRLEADKDVQAFYHAVSASYEHRQDRALERLDGLRRSLDLPEAANPPGVLEKELLGGDDAEANP